MNQSFSMQPIKFAKLILVKSNIFICLFHGFFFFLTEFWNSIDDETSSVVAVYNFHEDG